MYVSDLREDSRLVQKLLMSFHGCMIFLHVHIFIDVTSSIGGLSIFCYYTRRWQMFSYMSLEHIQQCLQDKLLPAE